MTLLSIWFGWTTTTSPWFTTGMMWGYLRNHPQMAELKWTIPHTLVVWLPFFTFPYIVQFRKSQVKCFRGVEITTKQYLFLMGKSSTSNGCCAPPPFSHPRAFRSRRFKVPEMSQQAAFMRAITRYVSFLRWRRQIGVHKGRFAGGVLGLIGFQWFSSLCALKKPTCLALGRFETGGTWGTAMVSAPQFSARHVKSKSPAGPSCAKEIWDDLSGWVVGIHESTTTWFSSNTF